MRLALWTFLGTLVMGSVTPVVAQQELGRNQRKRIPIQWSELQTKHYLLRFESVIPAPTAQRVAASLEEVLEQYIKVFKFKPGGDKFKVKFLDSMNTYEQEGGDPSHPGKYFLTDDTLILRQMPFYQLLPTVYHEAMHQYLHRYVGPGTPIPIWFDEGMAMYFEGMQANPRTKKLNHRRIDNRKLGRVQRALMTRTEIPFQELIDADHEKFHEKNKEELHYSQSFAVAYFLMNGMGARKALNYAKILKETQSIEAADASIFGKERKKLKSLAKKWKAFILRVKLSDGTKA